MDTYFKNDIYLTNYSENIHIRAQSFQHFFAFSSYFSLLFSTRESKLLFRRTTTKVDDELKTRWWRHFVRSHFLRFWWCSRRRVPLARRWRRILISSTTRSSRRVAQTRKCIANKQSHRPSSKTALWRIFYSTRGKKQSGRNRGNRSFPRSEWSRWKCRRL